MRWVDGLGGVFLFADDAAALAAWYTEHFGIEFELDAAAGNYWLDFYYRADADPSRRLSTVFAIMPAPRPLGAEQRGCMINYRVADLDGCLAQLAAGGVPDEGREDWSYGRFAWVRDPEGNRVELYQPL